MRRSGRRGIHRTDQRRSGTGPLHKRGACAPTGHRDSAWSGAADESVIELRDTVDAITASGRWLSDASREQACGQHRRLSNPPPSPPKQSTLGTAVRSADRCTSGLIRLILVAQVNTGGSEPDSTSSPPRTLAALTFRSPPIDRPQWRAAPALPEPRRSRPLSCAVCTCDRIPAGRPPHQIPMMRSHGRRGHWREQWYPSSESHHPT